MSGGSSTGGESSVTRCLAHTNPRAGTCQRGARGCRRAHAGARGCTRAEAACQRKTTACRSIASGAHKAVKADVALPQAFTLSNGDHLVDAHDHVAQRACRARKADAIVKHPRRVERVRDDLALIQRS